MSYESTMYSTPHGAYINGKPVSNAPPVMGVPGVVPKRKPVHRIPVTQSPDPVSPRVETRRPWTPNGAAYRPERLDDHLGLSRTTPPPPTTTTATATTISSISNGGPPAPTTVAPPPPAPRTEFNAFPNNNPESIAVKPPYAYSDAYQQPFRIPSPNKTTAMPNMNQAINQTVYPSHSPFPQPPIPPLAKSVHEQEISPLSRTSQYQMDHRRSASIHSTSSGTSMSQPIYMNAIPTMNNGRQQQQQHAPQLSQNSFQSATTHSRGNSVSSHASRRSVGAPSTRPEIPGMGVNSRYVREIKHKTATVWCDVPSKVWGLPVGMSPKNNGPSTTTQTYAVSSKTNYLKRAMDIRHSHLTPRLLASEVDEEDDGIHNINTNNSTSTRTSSVDMNRPASTTDMTPMGARPTIDEEPQDRVINDIDMSPRPLSRAPSVSSTKSVEEDVGKIRLFVANPDED
jgi:hypothetical protein